MIDLEQDLQDARDILEGRSMKQPTLAMLRALQIHHEDTLIVIALKVAKMHDDVMGMP